MEKDDYVARDIVLALFVNMKYFDLSAKNVVEVLLFPLKNEVTVKGIRCVRVSIMVKNQDANFASHLNV